MTSSCCAAGEQGRQGGDCCATDGNVMLLACSGGSNVGQLANRACVELTQDGLGKMFCLAGIGGKLSGFVQSAKDVPEMVVLDGCELGCAKAIFEQAGVPLRNYLVLTELGIAKNKDFELKDAELAMVKDAARQALAASRESC
ncbi:MAG: putative zinc-binding protein [Desulfarculaceae bacterium]|nr:putative zinc-binding protein [Desulfarculaceae bacterium]